MAEGPPILWRSPFIDYPFASNPTTAHSVVLFLWLNGWSRHIWCATFLNDIKNVQMLSFRTLVHVLCNKVSSLLRSEGCSYLYYTEWIIHWHQKFTFHNVFSIQRLFTCKSHICWLDAIRLGSFCETQIIKTEMVCVNKQNTHTHTKHSEKDI